MPEEFRDPIDPASADAFDVANLGAEIGAPEPTGDLRKLRRRKDGQPWGKRSIATGAKPAEKVKGSVDLSSLTGMFVGLHVAAANWFQVPELVLEEREGKDFMSAAQNVMRHYSVETTQKTLDWIAFGGVCCMIYGTRWGAYMMRKKAEDAPRTVVYSAPSTATPGASLNGSGRAAPQQPVFHEHAAMAVPDFESE